MALDSYPQEPQGVIKLLNNYTTESKKDRNSRKIYVKEQTRVSFTQTQYKNTNENKKQKSRESCIVFNAGKNTTGKKYALTWKRNSMENYTPWLGF